MPPACWQTMLACFTKELLLNSTHKDEKPQLSQVLPIQPFNYYTQSTYYKIYWQLYPNFYLTSKLQCIMDKNRFIQHCMTFWFWTGLSTFHHQHWRMGSIDLIHNWKRTFDFLDFNLLEALECSVVKMYEVKPQLTIAQLKSDWLGKKAKKATTTKSN